MHAKVKTPDIHRIKYKVDDFNRESGYAKLRSDNGNVKEFKIPEDQDIGTKLQQVSSESYGNQ